MKANPSHLRQKCWFFSAIAILEAPGPRVSEAASSEGPVEQTWVLQDRSLGSRRCKSSAQNARWVSSFRVNPVLRNRPGCHPIPPCLAALGAGTQLLLADLLGTVPWLTIAGVTPVPHTAPRSADESANPALPLAGTRGCKALPSARDGGRHEGITVTISFEEETLLPCFSLCNQKFAITALQSGRWWNQIP